MTTPLSIRLFANPSANYGDTHIHLTPHEWGVLAILAVEQGRLTSRTGVADILWDEAGSSKARRSLSQVVYVLNKLLPPDCLHVSRTHLMLDPNTVRVDYTAYLTATKMGQLEEAITHFHKSFLDDIPYISDTFDDWRTSKEAYVERSVVESCRRLVAGGLEQGDYSNVALVCAKGMLVEWARNEFFHARIEALAMSGRLDEANCELTEELSHAGAGSSDLCALQERVNTISPASDSFFTKASVFLPLVGRKDETDVFNSIWDESQTSCQIVALSGDPGIGKTRLVHQWIKRLVLRGTRCYVHQCAETENTLAYAGLIGILHDGARTDELDGIQSPWRESLASVAPEIFPAIIPPQPRSPLPTDSRRVLREAFAQYLGIVSKSGPVIIAIDDYQWIDDLTHEVLVYVTKRFKEQGLLIVISGRGKLQPPTYEDDVYLTTAINLQPLRETEIGLLIDAFCDKYTLDLSDSIRRSLQGYAAGRPLLLVEVLRQLVRNPLAANSLALPSTISKHVENQIEGLSIDAQLLLWAAATLHQDAGLDFLVTMTGLTPSVASRSVRELGEACLLGSSDKLYFRHELIRRAVRHRIPAYEASLWHHRAAESYSYHTPEAAHLIALHYELAGYKRLAFKHSKRAARVALSRSAFSDAEQHILRMLRCSSHKSRRVPLQMLLELYSSLGQYNKLKPFENELQTIKVDNLSHQVLISMVSFHTHELSSDLERIVGEAKEILLLARTHAPDLLPRVLWQVADHIRRSDEQGLMREFAIMMEAMGSEASAESSVDMLSVGALLFGAADGYEVAMPLAERASAAAKLACNAVALSKAYFAKGTVLLWAGHIENAAIEYDNAISAAEETGLESLLHTALANLAVVLMEQGELDRAETIALRALDGVGYSRRAYSYGNLALISLRKGNLDQVRHYAAAMAECHRKSPQLWIPMHVEAFLGSIDLARGDVSLAAQRAEYIEKQASAATTGGDTAHIHIFCAAALSTVYGNPHTLQRLIERALATKKRDYIGGARMLIHAELLARRLGQCHVKPESILEIRDYAIRSGAVALGAEANSLISQ